MMGVLMVRQRFSTGKKWARLWSVENEKNYDYGDNDNNEDEHDDEDDIEVREACQVDPHHIHPFSHFP